MKAGALGYLLLKNYISLGSVKREREHFVYFRA